MSQTGLFQGVSEGLERGLQGFIGERDRRDKLALKDKELESKRLQLARQLQQDEEDRQLKIANLVQGGAEFVGDDQPARKGLITYKVGDQTLGFDPELKQKRALEVASAKAQAENAVQGSPGQQAVDKKFADEYVDYATKGGAARIDSNLASLTDVAKSLVDLDDKGQVIKGKEGVSGGLLQKLPFGAEFATRALEPQKAAVLDKVRRVVFQNLRDTFGPQFTEREGEKLVNTAYDASLPPEINYPKIVTLGNLIAQQGKARKASSDYFEKHGTIRGYKGPKVANDDDFVSMVVASLQKDKNAAADQQANNGLITKPTAAPQMKPQQKPLAPRDNMVMVKRGNESYLINREDLPSAMKDGFQEISTKGAPVTGKR